MFSLDMTKLLITQVQFCGIQSGLIWVATGGRGRTSGGEPTENYFNNLKPSNEMN